MTDAQKTKLGMEIQPDIAEVAKLRQEQLGKTHGDEAP